MKIKDIIEDIRYKDYSCYNPYNNACINALIFGAILGIGVLAVDALNIDLETNKTQEATKENNKEGSFDFSDTSLYKLVYIKNDKNNEVIPYIIKEELTYDNNNQVIYEWKNIENQETILQLDKNKTISNDTSFSYTIVSSLDDYLIEHNLVKMEYNLSDFKDIINNEKSLLQNENKQLIK